MAPFLQFRLPRARVLALVFALTLMAAPGMVADEVANEYELKAVMLFNLARFVDWPAKAFADSNSPIVIGILGRNPFGVALEKAVRAETVNGRLLVVEKYDSLRALKPCHILFICASEKPRLSQILNRVRGQPILTVSEIDGFVKYHGGMVCFLINDQKKIRLRLNLESVRAEGMGVSSKLIQVAELHDTSLLWPFAPQTFSSQLADGSPSAVVPPFAK